MPSAHARHIGAVLAGCLAVVAIHDADTLRRQRQTSETNARSHRPATVTDVAPSRAPTVTSNRTDAAGERTVPTVRLDKLGTRAESSERGVQ